MISISQPCKWAQHSRRSHCRKQLQQSRISPCPDTFCTIGATGLSFAHQHTYMLSYSTTILSLTPKKLPTISWNNYHSLFISSSIHSSCPVTYLRVSRSSRHYQAQVEKVWKVSFGSEVSTVGRLGWMCSCNDDDMRENINISFHLSGHSPNISALISHQTSHYAIPSSAALSPFLTVFNRSEWNLFRTCIRRESITLGI